MTRAEYIREVQHSRRKKRKIEIVKRIALGLGGVALTFLICCGCIFVWDTFWGEKEGSGSDILAADATLATGTLLEGNADKVGEGSKAEVQTFGSGEAAGLTEAEPVPEEEKEPTVVIDAGHGGKDGGTSSGKTIEKDITLAVAQKMQKLLEEEEIKVVMTRDTDVFLKLEERAQISNENDTDLFISVHCNYYEGSADVNGIECYFAEGDEISREVAGIIMKNIDKIKGLRNRGPKEEDYYVTKNNDAPAVLVEMGFLSNPTECKNLADDAYQQSLAEELVEGILKSLDMLAEETTDKA